MHPLVAVIPLSLDKPSPRDKRADRERLIDGLSRAGIDMPVEITPEMLRAIPALIRKRDFSITLVLGILKDRAKVLGFDGASVYALAVDTGTTNIVASLFDVKGDKRIGVMETGNPQIALGPDVLSRVHAAMGGRGGELHRLLIKGINDLIHKLCKAYGINCSDIYAAAIAGNTIITHFLLDLPVDNISVEPYIPAAHRFDFVEPDDVGLDINRNGITYVFPNAGSYVGGDIVAGILSTGLYRHKEPSMLIDVGTNAEIVLGCDEWIIVGAGAAGPALEGGISEIGMRASEGAIYNVEISPLPAHDIRETDKTGEGGHDFVVNLKTIGGAEPAGICGSGVIELVSELYNSGIINRQGRFTGISRRITKINGQTGFVIYGSGDKRLIIKDTDIENFLRSKAAMFASLYVIVKSVGLRFGDIERIHVSGALGMGINTDKAVSLGMIPDIGRNKFFASGNSSLKGAEMVLADAKLLPDIDRICEMITYREMNTDGEFMKEFPGALFIPHTSPEVLRA